MLTNTGVAKILCARANQPATSDAIERGDEQGRREPAGVAEQGSPGGERGQVREAGRRPRHAAEPDGAPQPALDPMEGERQRRDAG